MSQLPAAYNDGMAPGPPPRGPFQPKRRIAGKRKGSSADAEAYASASTGQASSPSGAEAYVSASYASASTGQASSQPVAEAYVSASAGQVPDVPTTVLKRPAAYKRQAPVQYEAEAAIPPPPPAWSQHPCDLPKWAPHALRVLMDRGHLSNRTGTVKRLELTVWSDCSGINSEMFALRELANELRDGLNVIVTWVLYMTCESDQACQEFARLNHAPRHISERMEHRNFQTGQVHCMTHGENHPMPRHGVDLYVGTYPCTPWSRRGKRTGFDHPDAEVSIIGFKTIAFIGPAVFVIELGEVPRQEDLQVILSKVQEVVQAGSAKYTIQVVRNLTPAWSGYPTRRKRVFLIGWRADIEGASAGEPLQSLMDAPMMVQTSFLRFLDLQREVDWSRVGECPTAAELLHVAASACKCGLDPMVCCPEHPCKCGRCGESGVECTWRAMFTTFVASGSTADVVRNRRGTLTYLQVLEMTGRKGPQQPRQRVLINLIAILPATQPLNDTLMVGDISQNPPFADMYAAGDTPVFTTSSSVWVFQVGQALRTHHTAALMGLDLSMLTFSARMSESWFRQRLGMAVHIPNFGLVLMAALAPPLRAIGCA